MKPFLKRYAHKIAEARRYHVPLQQVLKNDLVNLAFDVAEGLNRQKATSDGLAALYVTVRQEATKNPKIAEALEAIGPSVLWLRGDENIERVKARFADLMGEKGTFLERTFLDREIHGQTLYTLLELARTGHVTKSYNLNLAITGPSVTASFDTREPQEKARGGVIRAAQHRL